MVRTAKSHHQEDEEIDDEEFTSTISSQKVKLGGNNNNQKVNAVRSKHSETEQRRRCKINERFQILRNLIPENDQKRDKASFLLEVIQYIQFLQEKIQMYEEPCQGWSSESSKLMPWRSNLGPVENFVDQLQFVTNGSSHADHIAIASSLLSNSQNSIESDLSAAAVYRPPDHLQVTGNQEIPLNTSVQTNLFEVMSAHPPQCSFPEPNHFALDSPPQMWSDKPCSSGCTELVNYSSYQEQQKTQDGEANISNVHSQGLLNTLTRTLQSSGVDLSQTSISVQLDVGQRTNGLTDANLIAKDSSSIQQVASYGSSIEDYNHISKKLKT